MTSKIRALAKSFAVSICALMFVSACDDKGRVNLLAAPIMIAAVPAAALGAGSSSSTKPDPSLKIEPSTNKGIKSLTVFDGGADWSGGDWVSDSALAVWRTNRGQTSNAEIWTVAGTHASVSGLSSSGGPPIGTIDGDILVKKDRSPDGWSQLGAINVQTGDERTVTFPGCVRLFQDGKPTGPGTNNKFSTDKSRIVCSSATDPSLIVFDAHTGQELERSQVTLEPSERSSFCLDPTYCLRSIGMTGDDHLVIGTSHGTLLWSINGEWSSPMRLEGSFRNDGTSFSIVSITGIPKTSLVAVAMVRTLGKNGVGNSGRIVVVDINNQKIVFDITSEGGDNNPTIMVGPNGTILAVIEFQHRGGSRLTFYTVASGSLNAIGTVAVGAKINPIVAFDPTGRRALVLSANRIGIVEFK